jgi:uncharacterized membrane protein
MKEIQKQKILQQGSAKYISKNTDKTNKIIFRRVLFTLLKIFILFIIGGSTYIIIEILFRGRSHISMFFLGGLCFTIIGGINNYIPWKLGLIQQMTIGSIIITILEYITGYIVNIKLGWNVWDYSDRLFNVNGQVCLLFSIIWLFISLLAILLDDWLRYKLFNEEKPHYKIV